MQGEQVMQGTANRFPPEKGYVRITVNETALQDPRVSRAVIALLRAMGRAGRDPKAGK